jgi:hypothetical protein
LQCRFTLKESNPAQGGPTEFRLSPSREPNTSVAEADDVGSAIASGVCQESRVPVYKPASRIETEVRDDQPWGIKRAIGQGA